MFPTISHVASYSTHQDYSIDFFGDDQLIVTVTPSASITSRWISEVLLHNSNTLSSHPLVVGVGVQWSLVSDPFNIPPYSYNTSPWPHNYSVVDCQRNSYYLTHRLPCYYYPPNHHNNYYPINQHNNYFNPSSGDYHSNPLPRGFYDNPPPDTLQLCVGKRCLIFQLSHCDYIPEDLRTFLVDQETIFVGIWNSQDARKLARSRHQLEIGVLHDIRYYMTDLEGRSLRGCSFEEIVRECMGYIGVRLDGEIGRSDWSVYELDPDQILLASLDVYVCHELCLWVRLWEL